jgi:hypothetical protein
MVPSTHIADLNQAIPAHLRDKYGLIYNGGTIEHIFDVRAVLRNLHDMLKIDGVVVHVGPMNGWVEHGFYQFCPTFFADFYHANRYDPLPSFVLKALSADHLEVEVHPYLPGKFDDFPAGAFLGVWNFFMPFVKRSRSTWNAIPQQGYYTRLYGNPEDAAKAAHPDSPTFILSRGTRPETSPEHPNVAIVSNNRVAEQSSWLNIILRMLAGRNPTVCARGFIDLVSQLVRVHIMGLILIGRKSRPIDTEAV